MAHVCAGQHMVVGVWDSCCYVLRRDLLSMRACNREAVLWLKLAGTGSQKHMCAASPQDQKVAPHHQHEPVIIHIKAHYCR